MGALLGPEPRQLSGDQFITGRCCYQVRYQGNYYCYAHVIIMHMCVTVVSCSMFLKPESGLLYFVLYKSSHAASAYKVAKQIVVSAPFVFLPANSPVCPSLSCPDELALVVAQWCNGQSFSVSTKTTRVRILCCHVKHWASFSLYDALVHSAV